MNFLRQVTDTILSAAYAAGRVKANEKIKELRANARRNFKITAIMDAVMLAFLGALCFFHTPFPLNAAGMVVANLAILCRWVQRIIHFIKDVYKPYTEIIHCALPAVWQGIIKQHSVTAAVENGIRAAFRFFYNKLLPKPAKNIIVPAAEITGVIKPLGTIEDDAVKEFGPPVIGYVKEAFIYNFVLFTVCYGVVVFLVRFTIINRLF